MRTDNTIGHTLGVLVALLAFGAAGCEWWVWKGDDAADLADGEDAAAIDEEAAGTDGTENGGGDTTTDGTDDTSGGTGEVAFCLADSDCAEGRTCQDGLCAAAEPVASDDLRGWAVDAATSELVDFDLPLAIGDTLTLTAPDPDAPELDIDTETDGVAGAGVRQLGSGCACAWSVEPPEAGAFGSTVECDTTFTVAQDGALTLAVAVTCAGRTTTYRQAATAAADPDTPSCTVDDDCADSQTCQSGTCQAAPATPCTSDEECAADQSCQDGLCVALDEDAPTMELLELQTLTPFVVRFDLHLAGGSGEAIPEGVTAEHFRIYETDERLDLTETNKFITPTAGLPLKVMLVLDYSNSMRTVDAIGPMIAAAEAFIEADHFTGTHTIGIVEFHDRADQGMGYSLAVPLTKADPDAKNSIVRTLPAEDAFDSGLSRVWDAVALAIDTLAAAEAEPGEQRAVVFLTDGRDTTSVTEPDDLIASASEHGVNFYPIGFGNVGAQLATLQSLADDTGGAYYPAADSGAFNAAFADIADNLKGRWGLTYITPQNSGAVNVRLAFDWGGGEAELEETFDAAGLAGDVHQGIFDIADRYYDATLNRTEFVIRARYVPRGVDRFRFAFGSGAAILNLQDAGGLTPPAGAWSITPLGLGLFDVLGPAELEYGAFGNLGVASVPGNALVLQISHDDTIYTSASGSKSFVFDGPLWAQPYVLTAVIEPPGAGSVVIGPDKSGYADGEVVVLTAVDGTKAFSH
ncbi:MAG: VWA domain-containing protein, partial [bacterium]|nr:VWA domain-containing protein [bacterium]